MNRKFYESVNLNNKNNYHQLLKCICSLSGAFASTNTPYIDYRAVENIFCIAFEAENVSRSDCSIDAKKGNLGIGIKTFLQKNGKTLQKVAEFNKDSQLLQNKEPKEIVEIVSDLRNKRLKFTKRLYAIEELIYHCVTRDSNKLMIFECSMDEINLRKISSIKMNGNNISFKDDKNEYSFNISKSTLYKRFYTLDYLDEFEVKIINNPFNVLKNIDLNLDIKSVDKEKDYIVLPLYSDKGQRRVPEKSGLNQWNASGRKRNVNEVYIPIPSCINKEFPHFFPGRDKDFSLHLPSGKNLSAKVCQDNNKALMSNPNKALGDWILRDVLDLEIGEILTYQKLEEIGLDSVVIYKADKDNYHINFVEIGSYDDFIASFE